MDTKATLIDMLTHPAVVVVVAIVVVDAAMKMHFSKAKKADLVTAKPLSLTEEQAKSVTMCRRHRPKRISIRMPAAYATDDEVNAWADTVAPRIGDGFQATEVQIIPQRFGRKAMYEVTFAKLRSLR